LRWESKAGTLAAARELLAETLREGVAPCPGRVLPSFSRALRWESKAGTLAAAGESLA